MSLEASGDTALLALDLRLGAFFCWGLSLQSFFAWASYLFVWVAVADLLRQARAFPNLLALKACLGVMLLRLGLHLQSCLVVPRCFLQTLTVALLLVPCAFLACASLLLFPWLESFVSAILFVVSASILEAFAFIKYSCNLLDGAVGLGSWVRSIGTSGFSPTGSPEAGIGSLPGSVLNASGWWLSPGWDRKQGGSYF